MWHNRRLPRLQHNFRHWNSRQRPRWIGDRLKQPWCQTSAIILSSERSGFIQELHQVTLRSTMNNLRCLVLMLSLLRRYRKVWKKGNVTYFYAGKMRKEYSYLNMDSRLPADFRNLDHQTLHQPFLYHCRKLLKYVLQILHSEYLFSYGNTTVLRCRKRPTSFCIDIR
jgi:hypothetical protein